MFFGGAECVAKGCEGFSDAGDGFGGRGGCAEGIDGQIVAVGEVTEVALDVEGLALQRDSGVVELVDSLVERVPVVVHDILLLRPDGAVPLAASVARR